MFPCIELAELVQAESFSFLLGFNDLDTVSSSTFLLLTINYPYLKRKNYLLKHYTRHYKLTKRFEKQKQFVLQAVDRLVW